MYLKRRTKYSNSSNHSNIFLIEMILSILFFSIAAAICIQLFAHSKQLSLQSRELTEAIVLCNNTAEVFKSCDNTLQPMNDFYKHELDVTDQSANRSDRVTSDVMASDTDTSGPLNIYYDSSFSICQKEQASYCVMVTPEFTSYLAHAVISVTACGSEQTEQTEIYSLAVSHPTNKEAY